MKTLQNKFWQTHRCSPSQPARISPLNLSLNILGRFLGHKFSVESCEGTLGVMRDIWRHEWGGGTWNTGPWHQVSTTNWSIVSTNTTFVTNILILIMDEIGHWGQKQAHYSGPGGAVDINSDVRDVMKRVGEMRWWQHKSSQHFPLLVLGVIIRQDSCVEYHPLWIHTTICKHSD